MSLLNKLKQLFKQGRVKPVTYTFNISNKETYRYRLGGENVNVVLKSVRVTNVNNIRRSCVSVVLNIDDNVGIAEGHQTDTSILHILNIVSKQSKETFELNKKVDDFLNKMFKDDLSKTMALTITTTHEISFKYLQGLEVIRYIIANNIEYSFREIY